MFLRRTFIISTISNFFVKQVSFVSSALSTSTYVKTHLCVAPSRQHRPLVPEAVVIASYGVAISYVTADAISKGVACAKNSGST